MATIIVFGPDVNGQVCMDITWRTFDASDYGDRLLAKPFNRIDEAVADAKSRPRQSPVSVAWNPPPDAAPGSEAFNQFWFVVGRTFGALDEAGISGQVYLD